MLLKVLNMPRLCLYVLRRILISASVRAAILALTAAFFCSALHAQARNATATTITVTSGGSAASSVSSGAVVTLTASVQAGAAAVTPGQVAFCDASATYCTDIHRLGLAQLTSAGKATLIFRPGIGSHLYKAVFLGTNTEMGSSSSVATLTVTGQFPSVTTMQSTCCLNPYTLTATVAGIVDSPSAPAPTGTVTFPDTSYSSTSLGSASLGAATAGLGFVENAIAGSYNGSNAMAAADFNGDGIPDVALTSGLSGSSVAIYLGKGDGTFNPVSATLATGQNPEGIVVADFNDDGIPDLAVSSIDAKTVTIFLGKGDGTFPTSSTITLSEAPIALVTGDFNGDGIADLAVLTNNSVIVYLGKGDGTFSQVATTTAVSSPAGIAAGDFNGDGITDLAVPDNANGTITILLGNGNGTFTSSSVSVGTGVQFGGIAAADLNGDGKMDLAVSDYGVNGAGGSILLGNGNGTFQTPQQVSEYISGAVAVADVTGDGIPDLVTGGGLVLLGKGDGTFSAGVPIWSTGSFDSGSVAIADLNGDGVPDIVEPEDTGGFAAALSQPTETATATLNNVTPAGPGPHEVEASYAGDTTFTGSSSGTTNLAVEAATPVLSVSAGTYTTVQSLTITDPSQGATIYYSEYGTVSTAGFVKYSGPISLSLGGQEFVQAYAEGTGYDQSSLVTAAYQLNFPAAPAPQLSLQPGYYSTSAQVSITDPLTNAQIYYTTNGTQPTISSTVYTGQITVPASEDLVVGAIAPGYSMSSPAGGQYFIGSANSSFIYNVAGNGRFGYSGDSGPATFADLNGPMFAVRDSAGNIYIDDTGNNRIRKIAAGTGVITTYAGNGIAGYKGDGGAATSAELNQPTGLALDARGNLYIADSYNAVVREVNAATGVITTVAGGGTGSGSGPATSEALEMPTGVAVDSAGNLYIADEAGNIVWKVSASTGDIAPFAGGNYSAAKLGDGGPATSASLTGPEGVAVDQAGNVYIADTYDNRIRKVAASTGIITTVAGDGYGAGSYTGGYSGDGGPATSAELYFPWSVAVDGSGNLYIADNYNSVVREVAAATGTISTVAGNGAVCGSVGGDGGAATSAALCYPHSVSTDSAGNLLVTDGTDRVLEVTAPGPPPTQRTAAPVFTPGAGSFANAQSVALSDPTPGASIYLRLGGTTASTTPPLYRTPLNVDGSVTLSAVAAAPGYLPSAPVTAAYDVTTPPAVTINAVAGTGQQSNAPSAGNLATSTSMDPVDAITDASGNLYIADPENEVVWKISATSGIATVYAGTLGVYGPDGNGGLATSARLDDPSSLALDKNGNLYISDTNNNEVRVVSAKTGVISAFAGTGQVSSTNGDGGPAAAATLSHPEGIAFDKAGDLYIADTWNHVVRMVSAATGDISTVAGGNIYPAPLGDGGPATAASLSSPAALAFDSQGDLYIADYGRIRRVAAGSGIITTVAGNGINGNSGDGGPALQAEVQASGLVVDAAGDLFLSGGGEVREIPAGDSTIEAFAGSYPAGDVDTGDGGSPSVATFRSTEGLSLGQNGSLYIADQYGYEVRKVSFTRTAATPTFSLSAGSYYGTQMVSILDSTPDATIYYTADGSTPTENSTLYTGPVSVAQSETLQAMAIAGTYRWSSAGSVSYTIHPLTTPTVQLLPSVSSIIVGQPLTVKVTVAGGGSNPTPTGSVTLSSGSYNSGAVSLNAGAATIDVAGDSLAVGSDTLEMTYTPDKASSETYASATASSVIAVQAKSVPTVTLTLSKTSLTVAQGFSVTVTISGNPAPTGTVTLTSGSYSSGAVPLSGGSADISIVAGSLPIGTDTLTATYSPDATSAEIYQSETGTASVIVNPKPVPTIAVVPSSSTVTVAQPLTVAVTVSGSPTPTGTVTLSSGSYTSPTVALSSGAATIDISAGSLAVGTDMLKATYSPDAASSEMYQSGSGTASVIVNSESAPTIVVVPSSGTITVGQSLSVAVTVSGSPTPAGTVTLSSGSYTSPAVALSNGAATIVISAGSLAVGTDTLKATYSPDTASSEIYQSGSGAATVIVHPKSSPVMVVTPSMTSLTTAQSLDVTVTVTGSGVPGPTGSITLSSGSYSAQKTLASGSVSFSLAAGTLSVGSDKLTATYTPDASASPVWTTAAQSAAVTVTQAIGAGSATVTVKTSATNITNKQSVTVAVSVAAAGGQPVPTGSITLTSGSYSATQTLQSGEANFTVQGSALSAGNNTLTVAYSGDADYAAATGTAAVQVSEVVASSGSPAPVSPGGTTTTTVSLSAGSGYSGTMELSCLLTSSPAGAMGLPTCNMKPGSLVFTSGGSGTATLTIFTTTGGSAFLQPARSESGWLGRGAGVLAAVLLLGFPSRRRRKWLSRLALLAVVICAVGAVGCGGGSAAGGGSGGGSSSVTATTPGTYSFTVKGVDSANAGIAVSTTVNVIVQ